MISVLGAEKLSLVQIEAFLSASESVRFAGHAESYGWAERLLCHHQYPLQKRRAKGLLRAYVEHMTGFSRAQSTRLIGGYLKAGRIAPKPSLRPRFPAPLRRRRGTGWPRSTRRTSGSATRNILKREFAVNGKSEFERLARLSNGHLYNLRKVPRYGLRCYEKTRPAAVQIGERKKPVPNGQHGFLRAKGRKQHLYQQWQTPLEKLLSLDRPQQFLRPGLNLATLQQDCGRREIWLQRTR